ncbi:MAG: 30S ribosomal protein S8 [Nitrospirae bacterium]|nr:MAG: 30S ribosomal protein S8 [Nitrospirota bacterium]
MMTDPIADLLVRIQNGARRRHESVTVPASKLKVQLLRVMKAEGFIGGYEPAIIDGHPTLKVQLRYMGERQPVITGMRRISKPGKRVYVGREDVKPVMAGMGLAILSTSKGLMTDQESRRANLGGEVLCHIW